MWDDPIIQEVRKVRLEIEKECHGSSTEILQRAMTLQQQFSERLITRRPQRRLRSQAKTRKSGSMVTALSKL